MDNVIEVDFGRLDRFPAIGTLTANQRRIRDEIDRLRGDYERERYMHRRQLDLAFDRIRKLKRQLRASQPVTEQEVLRSLKRVHAGEPVSAAAVTAAMYAAPQHSTVIRVGLALSSLARAGTVRRFEPDYGGHAAACRWAPRDA